MIDFTRAFDSAWERMMVILFRPFQFGKWCAIGFSAFLAGLMAGGNGVNGSFNRGFNLPGFNSDRSGSSLSPVPGFDLHDFSAKLHSIFSGPQLGLVIFGSIVGMVIVFLVLMVVYWLGARGQFMFLDNIVRNRGAVSWPWQTYSRQAQSLFLFYLLIVFLSFLIMLPFLIVGLVMGIPLIQDQRWPEGGEIVGFILLGGCYFVVALVLTILLFIFREFGVPLMFRNGILARAAFMETITLVKLHPGSVALFVVLRIVIAIGVLILAIIVCCGTCCIAGLPYLGTVALLPVLVYVRCFTLDCLAQFGPQYNVWTVDVPVTDPTVAPPFSPPPPPV